MNDSEFRVWVKPLPPGVSVRSVLPSHWACVAESAPGGWKSPDPDADRTGAAYIFVPLMGMVQVYFDRSSTCDLADLVRVIQDSHLTYGDFVGDFNASDDDGGDDDDLDDDDLDDDDLDDEDSDDDDLDDDDLDDEDFDDEDFDDEDDGDDDDLDDEDDGEPDEVVTADQLTWDELKSYISLPDFVSQVMHDTGADRFDMTPWAGIRLLERKGRSFQHKTLSDLYEDTLILEPQGFLKFQFDRAMNCLWDWLHERGKIRHLVEAAWCLLTMVDALDRFKPSAREDATNE